jgi:hypothetical protein
VAAGDDVLEHLHEGVELGGGDVGVLGSTSDMSRLAWRSRVSERKISNRLGLHVAQEPEDLLPLPVQVGLVELLVPGVEIELEDLLLLLGQVGGDLLLGPAQDQRPDPAAQLDQTLGVGLLLDRAA